MFLAEGRWLVKRNGGSERSSGPFENKMCVRVSRNESGDKSDGTGHLVNPGPYAGFYLNSNDSPPESF